MATIRLTDKKTKELIEDDINVLREIEEEPFDDYGKKGIISFSPPQEDHYEPFFVN